ncbi:MAG: hypothetical protein N2V75_00465 [Methanophagales archaeon]|nr:hypothetical protein [Methanophagales archaeon]
MKVDEEEIWMYMFCRNSTITRIGYADQELSNEELKPLRKLMSRPEFNGFSAASRCAVYL